MGTRFLQSSDSDHMLEELTAHYDHGVATSACLLAGLRIFSEQVEQNTHSRVLTGSYALLGYATQYWIEYPLAIAKSTNYIDTQSEFHSLSIELCRCLGISKEPTYGSTILEGDGDTGLDSRLCLLRPYTALYLIVRCILLERSNKLLEDEGGPQGKFRSQVHAYLYINNLRACADNQPGAMLRSSLTAYQFSIQKILHMRNFPGVDLPKLERFKQDHRWAAFTCRMWPCPLASQGFETSEQQAEHEIRHTKPIFCPESRCQYPPFANTKSLQSHQARVHGSRRTGTGQLDARAPRSTIATRQDRTPIVQADTDQSDQNLTSLAPDMIRSFEKTSGPAPPLILRQEPRRD